MNIPPKLVELTFNDTACLAEWYECHPETKEAGWTINAQWIKGTEAEVRAYLSALPLIDVIVSCYEAVPNGGETAIVWQNALPTGGREGVLVINGKAYAAQQQAQDGNFRKRATRYFIGGKWSEWCKDDHDLFTPWGD